MNHDSLSSLPLYNQNKIYVKIKIGQRCVLFMCVCEKFPTKIESGEGSYVLSVCYKYPCNKQTLYNYMCKIYAWA